MINKQIKNNKGFTLVETMFAVLILTFTIVGLMSVVADSLFQARYARDEITVNYLLQEAVDYIRNDRDTTIFLGGGNWDVFYAKYSNCSNTDGCYFDVLANPVNIQSCPSDGCPFLSYDKEAKSDSFYNYDLSNGVTTNFKRKIIVTKNTPNPDEIDVTVTIDWKNGGLSATRSLMTSLLRWQQ
jgi:type II secretory pathway pseudopilin PulG